MWGNLRRAIEVVCMIFTALLCLPVLGLAFVLASAGRALRWGVTALDRRDL
jgi:hypothetical protein